MSPEYMAFFVFGSMSLLSALGVVLLKNPVKSALSLILSFFSLAALFVLQQAELIGVLEVLVYAGAIMVLFVFVIMLVENKDEEGARDVLGSRLALPVKVGAVLAIGWAIARSVARSEFSAGAPLPEGFGGAKSIGLMFVREYLFHFELTSVLLMVGIVGAVIVSRRGRDRKEEEAKA